MSEAAENSSRRKRRTKDRVLVYGLGKTGLSVARYLEARGVDSHYVDSRQQPPGLDELGSIVADAEVVTGGTPVAVLEETTHIVVSPGIADSDPLLSAAREAAIPVVSDIEVFTSEAKAPIVGVTGSNGKSTVTTLLALMCEAAGKDCRAGGNLGTPALDLLGDSEPDFYLLELSSFQLQRTENLPLEVAVLLNIADDHLDWHASSDEYRAAKARIFRQAENAVVNRAIDPAVETRDATRAMLTFGSDEPGGSEYGLREEDGETFLARGEQVLLGTADVAMVGSHNHLNALAALAAGQLMGLDTPAMLQVLVEFPGLPHRMQRVGSREAVEYVNDSKATNVDAAIAAIDSLDRPVVLIAGGQGKGGDFDRLAATVGPAVRTAVLIGEDAPQLADAFEGIAPTRYADDMHDAVRQAAGIAEAGDYVLLAPACASFDQFANYEARGDAFAAAFEELGQ